jgi:multidrug efflux pump subunit AcrA (membrane-fusion protein)
MSATLLSRRYMFIITIALGIFGAVIIVKSKPPMQHQPEARLITPVTTIDVDQYLVRPSITGFGEVEPDILLDAKAEVSGKVVFVNPQLRAGNILAKDTVVIKIEDHDYLLALKQAEADLAVSKANLKEMKLNLNDTEVNLGLAKEKLNIAKNDLHRNEQLLKNGSISPTAMGAQQTVVLQLKQEVQSLTNRLETLPSQLDVQEARIIISQAKVETQKRKLERTVIKLPFNARITGLSVEENQFVAQGALLFSAQTINKVQINAQFQVEQFRVLARGFKDSTLLEEAFESGDSQALFSRLGLSAKVRISGDKSVIWDAEVERINGSLDPASRTLGVIVSVDEPYKNIKPGIKPPLMQGMYTEVILQGKPEKYFVVPRDALHETQLFLVSENKHLKRINIEAKAQGSMLLIKNGLSLGDKIITSDVFPAINGMKLQPSADHAKQQQIISWLEIQQ